MGAFAKTLASCQGSEPVCNSASLALRAPPATRHVEGEAMKMGCDGAVKGMLIHPHPEVARSPQESLSMIRSRWGNAGDRRNTSPACHSLETPWPHITLLKQIQQLKTSA